MKRYHIAMLFALCIILACSFSASAEPYVFKDLNTNEEIADVISYVKIGESTKIIPEGEKIGLDIGETDIVEVIADNPSTPGIDYYSSFTLADVSGNTIYLKPAATIKGIVKDTLDNVVANAELKCECSEIAMRCPARTDKFGSFNLNIIGTGHCKIYANYKDAVGFVSSDLVKGDLEDVEIKLDKTILKELPGRSSFLAYAGIAIAAFAFVMFLIQFRFKKKEAKKEKKEAKPEIKEAKAEKTGKRSEDIMQTLDKSEKAIVEFLMSNSSQSYQAKIRHTLGIPRTTLARQLESLQKKRIIHIQKDGKAVRIKLTDWFLEKG